jgi:menaquinone-9 beta-reductase
VESCDVLVVGGGPAGSSCAWKLREAGADVIVIDRARFPRDKVCAGWITPQVIADLSLDVEDYRRGRTFQTITGFRTGLIGSGHTVRNTYDEPVSYGIRRCEFDHYLLERARVRLRLGQGVISLHFDRQRRRWIVNGTIEAPLLVGAGGHFCPVARHITPGKPQSGLVAAQEAEFVLPVQSERPWRVIPNEPELYFTPDLKGYGWCFRKGSYVNVGFGQIHPDVLPKALARFVTYLQTLGRIPCDGTWTWHGHAYLVSEPPPRPVAADHVLLVGDAAGLAAPQSGEGIRPAIESGMMAAAAIVDARGTYTAGEFGAYSDQLRRRFGVSASARALSRTATMFKPVVPRLFRIPWIVRHVILDRAFLQTDFMPLTSSGYAGVHQTEAFTPSMGSAKKAEP